MKTQLLNFRITPENRAILRARAKEAGVSITKYIESLLFSENNANLAASN